METMQNIVAQELNEERFNRKHIDTKIRAAIEASAEMHAKRIAGIGYLKTYIGTHYTYALKDGTIKDFTSKNARIAQLQNLDLEALVTNIFIGIAYCQRPELFTSVTAQLACRLGFSDKTEAITTMAEIVAVLCHTDAFDIVKDSRQSSLMVQSRIPLSQELLTFIEDSQYLPPMVCEPRELVNNYSSGYLTHNDSLLLGQGNHHDGDLCLDVLNKMNKVCLQVNTAFLSRFEENPTFALDTPEKRDQWAAFKRQSYRFYTLMEQAGNRFWLTHKVDKRGRGYAQGYHINPQSTAFKKAMVDLAKEELVQGVPA